MEEIWKDVDGYDGLYQVSNLGRVRNSAGLIMAQKPSKRDGYVRLLLCKNGKYKAEYVHILVAKHFVVKEGANELEVNHIDCNKSNNIFTNLEWVTKSQNTKHAIANGLRFENPSKGKFGKDNPNSKPVAQYDFDGNLLLVWDSRKDAGDFYGCGRQNICAAVNGWKASCCGFMWRDATEDVPIKIQGYAKKPKSVANENRTPKKQETDSHKKRVRPSKKIEQLSIDGTVVKTWDSAKQIGENTNYLPQNIFRCCCGKRPYAYGYAWRYAGD